MTIKSLRGALLCISLAWLVICYAVGPLAAADPAADPSELPTGPRPVDLEPEAQAGPPAMNAADEQPGLEPYVSNDGTGQWDRDCDECGLDECGQGDCCYGCFVGPSGRFWVRADYLLWWTRGSRLPPLITTSTNPNDAGVIGMPTTSVLFGDQVVNGGSRSNARLTLGFWFDCSQTGGVEMDLFSLGELSTGFSRTSDGDPVLARPYFDIRNNRQASALVAFEEMIEGTVSARAREYFHSGGIRVRFNLCCHDCCEDCGCEEYGCEDYGCEEAYHGPSYYLHCLQPSRYRIDLIGGYRSNRLDDSLVIREALISKDPSGDVPVDTTFDIEDSFRARNEFHGGELGLIAQIDRGRWSLELLAKMAFGNNQQIVTIAGSTLVTTPDGSSSSNPGGLLALPTNIGRYSRDEFVVIPQFGAEIGYQVNCNLRAYLGYNFLYWANVTRAADQIDLVVNTTQLPPDDLDDLVGPARPAFAFHDTDFWAQGLNFGLELRY